MVGNTANDGVRSLTHSYEPRPSPPSAHQLTPAQSSSPSREICAQNTPPRPPQLFSPVTPKIKKKTSRKPETNVANVRILVTILLSANFHRLEQKHLREYLEDVGVRIHPKKKDQLPQSVSEEQVYRYIWDNTGGPIKDAILLDWSSIIGSTNKWNWDALALLADGYATHCQKDGVQCEKDRRKLMKRIASALRITQATIQERLDLLQARRTTRIVRVSIISL